MSCAYGANRYTTCTPTATEYTVTPHCAGCNPCGEYVRVYPFSGGHDYPYPILINSFQFGLEDSIATKPYNSSIYVAYRDTTERLAKYSLQTSIWESPRLLHDDTLVEFNDSMKYTGMGEIMVIDTSIFGAHSTTITDSVNWVNLSSTLSSITPASNVETNLQTATNVYLQLLINKSTSLSSTQYSTIQTLANKCPYLDGQGVYMAREIWAGYVNPFTVYPDSCSISTGGTGGGGTHGSERREQQIKDTINNTSISIHPNPNNGNFVITYNLGNVNNGVLMLFDELGERVGEYTISGTLGELQINNSDIKNGMYVYKLYTNNSILKIGKIIVIK